MKPLSQHQVVVLEADLRILRGSTAEAAAVTLDELEELLRVYRLYALPNAVTAGLEPFYPAIAEKP